MGRLALVGGYGFHGLEPWIAAPRTRVSVGPAEIELLNEGSVVVLPRHGIDRYRPPHMIDHALNLSALREAGCDRVLAICSVGALREELGVGTFLCPDDFISFQALEAAFGDERDHVVPGFDAAWRAAVVGKWRELAEPHLVDGGVYWQSRGPRFETPAEVRLIAEHADVVGMTMASECAVACQLRLAYAAICVVDNLANGVGAEPLTMEEYQAGRDANRRTLAATLSAVVGALAEGVLAEGRS